jgi:choline-sulfatase
MATHAGKPNVLLIMSDQQRFDYLGYMGASFVNTPNLDRLAARGTVFTHCTTNAPICAAARIGLATGLEPFRLGALGNGCYLPRSRTTYYQRMRDHGYRVGCVGKLDLAKPDPYNGRHGDRPCVFGWGFTHPEECEGKMHAGTSPTPIGPYTHYLHERGLLEKFHEDYKARSKQGWFRALHDSVLPTDAFEDCYIGRRAAEWIGSVPDDFPWHYFVSFVGPHDPFDAPKEYADRYRDKKMPPPIPAQTEGKSRDYTRRQSNMSAEQITKTRQMYCAAVELIDDQVGGIIEALEKRGMLDNTVIVFTSDHGEMLGDHGLYTKGLGYEQSIRVPLLLAGPGVPEGKTHDTLVELIDVNPTICEAVGLPRQEDIDAQSVFPFMRGERERHRTDVFSALAGFQCLRSETHKVIVNQNDCVELYDLVNDPDETTNIREGNSDIGGPLRSRMQKRLTGAKWRR